MKPKLNPGSKHLLRSKFFWIGLATIVAGVISKNWELALSGAITIINRVFTDKPVHVKKSKEIQEQL
jgi:hypothetical protein